MIYVISIIDYHHTFFKSGLSFNKDQAFNIWLENHKVDLATEDGKDCVCSYIKDYTQIGSTKEIAKIKLASDIEDGSISEMNIKLIMDGL